MRRSSTGRSQNPRGLLMHSPAMILFCYKSVKISRNQIRGTIGKHTIDDIPFFASNIQQGNQPNDACASLRSMKVIDGIRLV
jgi:hypothetical protein